MFGVRYPHRPAFSARRIFLLCDVCRGLFAKVNLDLVQQLFRERLLKAKKVVLCGGSRAAILGGFASSFWLKGFTM